MHMPNPQHFRAIREAGESFIDSLKAADALSRDTMGAINWSDLHVVEVLFCLNARGEHSWRVLIEEAAPESGIASAVYDHLMELFPGQVFDVAAEW